MKEGGVITGLESSRALVGFKIQADYIIYIYIYILFIKKWCSFKMRRRGTDSEYTADLSASHPGRRLMMHKTGNSRIPPNSRSTQNILTMLWIAAGVAIFSVLGSIGYFLGTGDFGDLLLDSANSMFGRR